MRRFEWDKAKNESKKTKHGIDFENAQLALEDALRVYFLQRYVDRQHQSTAARKAFGPDRKRVV